MKKLAAFVLAIAAFGLVAFTQMADGGLIISKDEARALFDNIEMIEAYVASMSEYITDLQKQLKASEAKQCI